MEIENERKVFIVVAEFSSQFHGTVDFSSTDWGGMRKVIFLVQFHLFGGTTSESIEAGDDEHLTEIAEGKRCTHVKKTLDASFPL